MPSTTPTPNGWLAKTLIVTMLSVVLALIGTLWASNATQLDAHGSRLNVLEKDNAAVNTKLDMLLDQQRQTLRELRDHRNSETRR